MAPHQVAVIGSLNIDFIIRTPRVPAAGETLTAHSFDQGFGGKGANQAVAAGRLADEHVQVSMVGNVGDDAFGDQYLEALRAEGIDGSNVRKLEGQKTGISTIIVDDASGENRILFTPNANYGFGEDRRKWDVVPKEAEVAVFQMEIPVDVVLHNIKAASDSGRHVILNPAPALPIPEETYQHLDTLILNETEASLMSEGNPNNLSPADLASAFLARGVKDIVIITLGGDGLVYVTKSGQSGRLPAEKVKVVDTTAAGDTFVGGYAVQRAKGLGRSFDYDKALRFATLAASKTVEREGAMAAIPKLSEVQ